MPLKNRYVCLRLGHFQDYFATGLLVYSDPAFVLQVHCDPFQLSALVLKLYLLNVSIKPACCLVLLTCIFNLNI